MRLMLDLNIVLDVVQKRHPHYDGSARILDFALKKNCGCIAAHALTTLYDLVEKYAGKKHSDELIDWLLQNFSVVPADKEIFLRARNLQFSDFEDAVICASAEKKACDFIITRNSKDFSGSTIPALTPGEFFAI